MSDWNRVTKLTKEEPAGLIAAQETKIAKLREALTEVQQWISNWDPSFIHDDEWSATARKIEEALKQSA